MNSTLQYQCWTTNLLLVSAWITLFGWLTDSPEWHTIFSPVGVSLWATCGLGLLFVALSQWQPLWQQPSLTNASPPKLKIHLVAALLPLLLFWLLYHEVLNTWFTYDDPCHLNDIDEIGLFSGFFDPNRQLSVHNYAPLFPVSFGLDHLLFGLDTRGFYWHQMLSFSLVLPLLYIVLVQFFSPLLTSMTLSLFVVTVSTAQVVHFLMVRHYIEGLGFSCLAIWLYLQAVRLEKRSWWLAGLGSVFYFLAASAKEIYVPLLIVLPWLPVGDLKTRWWRLIPYIVVAIFYIILRTYMLGMSHTLSGYPERTTTLLEILYFPLTYMNVMGWQAAWQWFLLLGVIIIWGVTLWRKPLSHGLPTLIWLAVVILPLVPIIWRVPWLYYYLFLPGLLFAIGCGIVLTELTQWLLNTPWRNAIVNFFFLAILLANLLPVQTEQARLTQMKQTKQIQDEFLLYNQSLATVLIYDYYCASSVILLREKILGHQKGVGWCPQDDCQCAKQYPGYTAKQYIDGQWQTKILSLAICDHQDLSQNLSVAVTFTSPKTVTWHLGPYPDNQGQYYALVLEDRADEPAKNFVKLPSQGSYTFAQPLSTPLRITVKYMATAGWETYSVPFVLDPKQVNAQGVVEVKWQRFQGP